MAPLAGPGARPADLWSDPRTALALAALLGVVPPVLMVVANQSTQLTAPLGLVAAAVVAAAAGRWPAGRLLTPLAAVTLAALAWMLASTAWAPRPIASLVVWLQITAVAVAAWLGLRAATAVLAPRHALLLAAGVAAAAVLVLAEFHLGAPLRRAVAASTEPFRLNRVVICLAVLVWAAALALVVDGRRWAAAALLALVVAAVASSPSHSAVLGLACGAAALLLGLVVARAVVAVVAAAIAALLATPVLIGRVLDFVPAGMDAVLKLSAFHRGEIWHWYAAAIPERWLAGYGLQATRYFIDVPTIRGYPPDALNALDWGHAHNAALQIWVELGAVGATIAAAGLALVGVGLARWRDPARAFALATFAAAAAVAFVSHGAWQVWWLGLLALAATWCKVAAGGVATGPRR